jgi:hypothetical protein
VFALLWGVIVVAVGVTQQQLLPGDLHWIVQLLHLAIGLAAMPIAALLSVGLEMVPRPACLPRICDPTLPVVDFRPSRSTRWASDASSHSREGPMKYLCLIYDNEARWATMSRDDGDRIMKEYFEFTDDIKKSGHMLAGESLTPTSTATTVRVRNGKLGTTDGPFAETKEQLGGFYMIEAKDLNEAIQVAARIPGAKTGSIEVRPVEVFG